MSQHAQLRGRLDPLGYHVQPEAVGHRHNGAYDCRIDGIHVHVAHESAVDLEHVDRQATQIAQAGVAGSEVVDRDIDAELAQSLQVFYALCEVIDQRAFRQLEHEPVRRHRGLLQHSPQRVAELALPQLYRRQIDRDRHDSHAFALPGDHLLARCPQHELAQRDDQAAVFGDRNESARRNQAPFRMGPPNERLEAHDALSRDVDERLVVNRQLTFLERRAQLVLEHQLLLHPSADDVRGHFELALVEITLPVRHLVRSIADQLLQRGQVAVAVGGPLPLARQRVGKL